MSPRVAGSKRSASLFFSLCLIPLTQPARANVDTIDFIAQQRAILEVNKPGYLNLARNPIDQTHHLLVSSFQMFAKDNLLSISQWEKGLTEPQHLQTSLLDNKSIWPNEARTADERLLNQAGLLVSGGFLVPGKSTGAITFVPWSNPQQAFPLTLPKKAWFYHRTEEWDVNGDGHLDIVTARAYKPMIGASDGELLWLENPGHAKTNKTGPWKEHIIGRGPDVHFRILPESNQYPLTILSTEFSAKKLSAYRQTEDGAFEYKVLDNTLGSAFDIQLEDLNQDGQLDLLVSNHEADSKASVFAYEMDFDSLTIKKRHTLLTGIETRQKAIKSASPGPVTAFYPADHQQNRAKKPWILVSGDGSQRAHILVPIAPNDPHQWDYREHILWNPKSTVGQSVVGDVDNDGQLEIFVPAYDANKVGVFTITPKLAK